MDSQNLVFVFQCSVSCGSGVVERDVICIKKSGRVSVIVGEDNCLSDDKPPPQQSCRYAPCRPRWHMSDWSKVIPCFTLFFIKRHTLYMHSMDDKSSNVLKLGKTRKKSRHPSFFYFFLLHASEIMIL